MAPVASALHRNLQRCIRRTRRQIFIVEDVRHLGIQLPVHVLLMELVVKRGLLGIYRLAGGFGLPHIDIAHLGHGTGHLDADDLMTGCGALNVTIAPQSQILTDDDLLRTIEVLRHLIDGFVALTLIAILDIRGLHRGCVPRLGESRTNDTLSLQGVGLNAEKSLNERAGRDAYAIAEITVTLTSGCVILAHLSEVGRRLAIVHLVHHIGLHQAEALLCPTRLKVGQRRVHHLGGSNVIDAP